MWSPGHPLQSSIQAPTEQQLGAPGQHQEDSYPFNPGGWKLRQDAVHLCKDEPLTHTWSKGEPIPLKRVQAPNGSRPGEEATLNPHSGPPGELHEPSTQYQGGVLRGSVTTVSSHLDPQQPGHLAQRANNPEPGRLLTVQQDAGDSKFGTFNHLTPMTTAWLPVIILFILSNCASLSFLHCPAALGVFTRIRNSAPSATKYRTWQSGIVYTLSPVPYLTRRQNPEESPDQGSGGSPMYQRLGCLRQRYQTPRTQRPLEVDHQTSSGQLPATVPPQQALVGCTQRTSNSHHNQILAIRRMGAYPWEHHQQPPRPTIWIE